MVSVVNTSVSFKIMFNNDCVLHSEADKISTDGRFSYQYYYSSFDQPKNYPAKNKKNHNRPKRGSGQNHFRPKKWSGHGRTGRTADDGLELHHLMYRICIVRLLHDTIHVSSADVSRFRYDTMNRCTSTRQTDTHTNTHTLPQTNSIQDISPQKTDNYS